jgi:hypothetical protein
LLRHLRLPRLGHQARLFVHQFSLSLGIKACSCCEGTTLAKFCAQDGTGWIGLLDGRARKQRRP